jgi:long-chain fatty acid transport protein
MKKFISLTVCLLAAGTPATGLAAGLILYEDATPSVGLGSAGYAARAQDASTLFKNPAGMSLLPGSQFAGGLELLQGNITFSPNGQTSARLGTGDGGNALPLLPEGSAYFTHQLNDKFAVGLGMMSYFGLAQNYDDDWVGRYYIQEGALLGVSFLPTLSYKVNDWLSVGAGMNAMVGYLKSEVAVNNLSVGGPLWTGGDGQVKLEDYEWGFGANAGILINLSERTRFGASYLSRVNLDFSDAPSWSNLRPGLEGILNSRGLLTSSLDLGVTVPQQVMGGVYHELDDKWAVMVDAGWQNWKQFGYVSVAVASEDPTSVTLDNQYENTWHLGGGAMFRLNPHWTFTGGVAYDSSPVSDANRSITLPMGEQWRFGLGAIWKVNEKLNLGAGWDLIWMGDLSVDQDRGPLAGRVSGTYEGAYVNVFALNLNCKF